MPNHNFTPMSEAKSDQLREVALRAVRGMPRQTLTPWSFTYASGCFAIEAYCVASGKRQVIAEVPASAGLNPESVAAFIVTAVNDYDRARELIRHMADALENCIACKGITWEAEHDGDIMIRRAQEWLGS
jgi:hypothetical protein